MRESSRTQVNPDCGFAAAHAHVCDPLRSGAAGVQESDGRNGGTQSGNGLRAFVLARLAVALVAACVVWGLCGCGGMSPRTAIAMAAASSQTLDSADKKQVLLAALKDISVSKQDGRWEMPLWMFGGRLQIGMPVVDKKGNLVALLDKLGRVVPVYGGLDLNFEKSFTDANRTVNSVISIAALARATEATAKAAETTAKEETARAANDNATKASMEAAKLKSAETMKGMELEAAGAVAP